jgi:hypothetical protein
MSPDHSENYSVSPDISTLRLLHVEGLVIPQDRRLSPAALICPGHGRLHSGEHGCWGATEQKTGLRAYGNGITQIIQCIRKHHLAKVLA